MAEIVTVSQRQTRESVRRQEAAKVLMDELKAYAGGRAGRFLVFGSAAQDRMSFDSDFDVVIDFPLEQERIAVEFVEHFCRRERLPADIHLRREVSDAFVARVSKHAVILSFWTDVDADLDRAYMHFAMAIQAVVDPEPKP